MAGKRKNPGAPKYRVVLNDHLVNEVIDQMGYQGNARAVFTRALFSIRWGVTRAKQGSAPPSKTLYNSTTEGRFITLDSLMRILADKKSIESLRILGRQGGIPDTPFGPKLEAAAREFCNKACEIVDAGFFRV